MNLKQRFDSPQIYAQQSDRKRSRNCIKFNRKQETARGDRKRLESHIELSERICFISPPKVNSNMPQYQHVAALLNSKVLNAKENFAVSKEQSYILPYDSHISNELKLNDSILSLMDQLKGENDRRHQSEVQQYLLEISNLRQELDSLQDQNNSLKQKVKDCELLQQFLIERQGYISEVTDKNIFLSEQLHRIQRENERICRQFSQLQADYTNQRQMYDDYIALLKRQKQVEKSELDMMSKLNIELNQKLQESLSKKGERFKRHSIDYILQQDSPKSPNKKAKTSRLKTQPTATLNKEKKSRYYDQSQLQLNCIDGYETFRSKETDMSELNVRSMEEYSILQKLNEPNQSCDCKGLIKNLKQKIRYSQIEIDVLKRFKLNAEKIKDQNQKLKNQNKKLLSRIQQLCNKPSKNDRKKSKHSDQSFDLSLSPKKYDR